MDYSTKIKCLGCGAMLAIVLVPEIIYCPKCNHVSTVHPVEQTFIRMNNFDTTTSNVSASSVLSSLNF